MNHTVSRVTGMRPVDITPKNAQEVFERVYSKYTKEESPKQKKNKLEPHDTVRMALSSCPDAKRLFNRGYFPNFSDQIFNVDEINKGDPNFFRLRNYKNQRVDGRFYNEELQKVRVDDSSTYRIEKVIRRRKRNGINELLVKFIGYDELEWIKESDIV